jgi:hypothetical protein
VGTRHCVRVGRCAGAGVRVGVIMELPTCWVHDQHVVLKTRKAGRYTSSYRTARSPATASSAAGSQPGCAAIAWPPHTFPPSALCLCALADLLCAHAGCLPGAARGRPHTAALLTLRASRRPRSLAIAAAHVAAPRTSSQLREEEATMRMSLASTQHSKSPCRSSRAGVVVPEELLRKMVATLPTAPGALLRDARVDQPLHAGRSEHVVHLVSVKQHALHLHAPLYSSTTFLLSEWLLTSSYASSVCTMVRDGERRWCLHHFEGPEMVREGGACNHFEGPGMVREGGACNHFEGPEMVREGGACNHFRARGGRVPARRTPRCPVTTSPSQLQTAVRLSRSAGQPPQTPRGRGAP